MDKKLIKYPNELPDELSYQLSNLSLTNVNAKNTKPPFNELFNTFICEVQHHLKNGKIIHLLNGAKNITEYYEYITYTYPERLIYSFSVDAHIITEISTNEPQNILDGTFKPLGKYEIVFYPTAFDCMAHLESMFVYNQIPNYIRNYPAFSKCDNLQAYYDYDTCSVTTIDNQSTIASELIKNSQIDILNNAIFKYTD